MNLDLRFYSHITTDGPGFPFYSPSFLLSTDPSIFISPAASFPGHSISLLLGFSKSSAPNLARILYFTICFSPTLPYSLHFPCPSFIFLHLPPLLGIHRDGKKIPFTQEGQWEYKHILVGTSSWMGFGTEHMVSQDGDQPRVQRHL